MTVIKVERRPVPAWLPIAVLVVLAAAVLGSWAWRSLHPDEEIGFDVPARYRGLAVAYEGRVWVPAGVEQLTLFPDGQMTKVGVVDGMPIYANPIHGMGGGGGGVEAPASLRTQPWGRIYVRVGEGRYLPMKWRSLHGH